MSFALDPRFEPPEIENPRAYEPLDPESVPWEEIEQAAAEIENIDQDPIDQELLEARIELRSALFGLDPEDVEQPGVCGEWSVRQIIAHVTGWDEYIYGLLDKVWWDGEALLAWPFDVDEFNAYHVAKREDMTWQDLLHAFRLSGWGIQGHLAPFEPDAWDEVIGRTTEGEPLTRRTLAQWLIDHDREHAAQIRAWRASIGKPARDPEEPPTWEEIALNLETAATATVWAIAQATGESLSEVEERLLRQAQEMRDAVMRMLAEVEEDRREGEE